MTNSEDRTVGGYPPIFVENPLSTKGGTHNIFTMTHPDHRAYVHFALARVTQALVRLVGKVEEQEKRITELEERDD